MADFYNMTVSKAARKQAIKEELYSKLVEAGIFPEQTIEQGDEADIGTEADSSSVASSKNAASIDPRVVLKLKELNLALSFAWSRGKRESERTKHHNTAKRKTVST